ncbi:glycosyltransferase [Halobacillus campisalis]|uniref:Glycosyltransferase n=1 Tax=Halobacillus campisalis TaxID=435909 RepID=A0ABW2K9H1_9BACI|nr:glycosyltransferase [Halobacillus campisalis]
MKTSLLFVIDSLDVAGAEKSLVSLLSLIDFDRFSVDVMLFSHDKPLEKLLPEEVNVLPPLSYTTFLKGNFKQSIKKSIQRKNGDMLYSRTKFSTRIRLKNYSNSEKARIYWQSVSKVIEKNPKEYDIAISYAQGVPTFYVAEKVKAKMKFAWVNVSYKLNNKDKRFQKSFYDKYSKIVAVSESARDVFKVTFPEYSSKLEVLYDINHPELIGDMAKIEIGFKDEFNGVRILTIGRLAHQKGYDIALDACQRLKDYRINFKWFVLGKGPLKKEIEEEIKRRDLSKHFILLGVKSNPYPLINEADIYVQTSKFEGFGLAIAEARILNTPVVTTEFDAVYNQMINGKNGLVVGMNGESVFQGIMKLLNNQSLKEEIIDYLKTEKKGNIEEVEKFYDLIS